jgi:hypothetical protein
MSWKFSRFATSLMSVFGDPANDTAAVERLDAIRGAMQTLLLTHAGPRVIDSRVWRDLKSASEIQTLWYLRIDLVGALSVSCGEATARQQVDGITELFRGDIPAGQMKSARGTRCA